jgi:hypothetical protein
MKNSKSQVETKVQQRTKSRSAVRQAAITPNPMLSVVKVPDVNSYVVFDKKSVSKSMYEKYYKQDFEGKLFVFLGEIKQCPGHCILTDLKNGKIIGMYHTDNFREATEDEC